ncbi:septum site-determining protein Ssd [uncultured Pseudokineococcus sp.]|uniref:septum site-determining protein Ssd n=1 Tax=uncultured Pseudokineococcus sp. TaxID=1642928 RepID=UPI002629C9E7|nr:septum site-determining protein Ssd [uncultured Pseudokineococcus sp.]
MGTSGRARGHAGGTGSTPAGTTGDVAGGGPAGRVVLVSSSAWVEEQVRRCAAAAGAPLEVLDPRGPGGATPAGALELWDASVLPGAGAPPPAPGCRRLALTGVDVPEGLWRAALESGASAVLLLPDDEDALVEALLEAADPRPADALVLGVLGGCGGAGASVLAACLAGAATRRAPRSGAGPRVLLADLDPLGCGADLLLGLEDEAGLRWEDLRGVRGSLRPDVLEASLPRRGGVDVLARGRGALARHDVPPPASAAVVAAARRSHDVVVLDLPRGARGAEHLLRACAPLLLVVPAEVPAAVAASRQLEDLARGTSPTDVRVVVRAGPRPTGRLRPHEVAEALGHPLAGVVPHDPALAARAAEGALLSRERSGGGLLRAAELLEHLLPPPGRAPTGPRPARAADPAGGAPARVAAAATAPPGWLPAAGAP